MEAAHTNWAEDDLRRVAAEHALGVADPAEAAAFEQLLREGHTFATEEWNAFRETAASLALDVPIVTPSARLRDRVLESLHEVKPLLPGFEEPLPGFHVLRSAEKRWRNTPFPGVRTMVLSADPGSDIVTLLIEMAPGASYPRHQHTAEEQCWVLQGDVRHVDGSIGMTAGDFVRAMPGTRHASITTDGGCLLHLVASAKDELL